MELYIFFLKFSCDPMVILSILKRREHTVGTKLGVTGPLMNSVQNQWSKEKVQDRSRANTDLYFWLYSRQYFFFRNDRHAIRHWAAL